MQRKLIFATGNPGKLREAKEILREFPFEIISMKEAGIAVEIEETGTSFRENAVLKVEALRKVSQDIIIADDSGLEIDALNKEPGIYSARYLGEDTSYTIKMNHLLERMQHVPEEQRTARFVAAVAAYVPGHGMITVEGVMEGRIGYEIKGIYGFGYDPIFYLPERHCYSAELLPEEKNKISHRAKALNKLAEELKRIPL